jgi:hypothetical protein
LTDLPIPHVAQASLLSQLYIGHIRRDTTKRKQLHQTKPNASYVDGPAAAEEMSKMTFKSIVGSLTDLPF